MNVTAFGSGRVGLVAGVHLADAGNTARCIDGPEGRAAPPRGDTARTRTTRPAQVAAASGIQARARTGEPGQSDPAWPVHP